ncbi:MAG TPA: SDR family oxidoreductase [bacterium]|nr:SDR family oxidoreductase [bacterium]
MSKIILITGASTGIGAEAARTLAPDNRIIVHYNSSEDAAAEVAEAVKAKGGTAHLMRADLSNEQGVLDLFDLIDADFDHLDVLINNAGGLIERKFADEMDWDLMELTFRLNVFSAMKLTSLCIPLLRKGTDPNIINLTSIAMRHGSPSSTIYGASKSALDSFTRGFAKELAPDIRVNAVAPGVIETPFHEKFSDTERMKAFAESTPLKRNGQAHHIARAIKFLIENDFTTGETVDVNGGLFMR